MSDPIASLADGLAAGTEAHAKASGDRFFGVVRAVNVDGTLTVETGVGWLVSVPANVNYHPRNVGDKVLLEQTRIGPVVSMAVGPPPASVYTQQIVWDANPPGGEGWREVAQTWVRWDGELWLRPSVAAPAAASVTQDATDLATYRDGALLPPVGVAEQGDPDGLGLRTGLATFGSWAALSGLTATGGTLTVHRRNTAHGIPGPTPLTVQPCDATGTPMSTPTLLDDSVLLQVAVNQTASVPVPAGFAELFCDGTATALGFHSLVDRNHVQLDAVTLTITY